MRNPNLTFQRVLLYGARTACLFFVLAASSGPILAAGLAKTDWPTWGGNSAHNKISPSTSKAPLTIYFRSRPFPTAANAQVFNRGSTPIIGNGVIYATTIPDGGRPPYLMAYDLHGRELWRSPMPNYDPKVGNSANSPTLADDGTIYVSWGSTHQGTKGITAFNSNGSLRFTGACEDSNPDQGVIVLDRQGNLYWLATDNNSGRILLSCSPDGTLRYVTGTGSGRAGWGPVIGTNDVIYSNFSDGVKAKRTTDGSDIWASPTDGPVDLLALSPGEKYLVSMTVISGVSSIRMRNADDGRILWQYLLGAGVQDFAFGLHDRVYVAANLNFQTGLFPGIPPTAAGGFNGKLCALDVPLGATIWCRAIRNQPQQSAMVVDSNNTVYFESGANNDQDWSMTGVNQDGVLVFNYSDKSNSVFNSNVPIMSDDGRLFVGDKFLEGFRPWTLALTALKKPAGSSTSVYFTVKSSILKRDLQDGVTADNQVQVRLDGGATIALKYLHQDGDDSVWEGVYGLPLSTDLSRIQLKGSVEAIANQTTTNLITHFASVPGGFNNTGMVQSFDLGTVDKLPGQAAQPMTSPRDTENSLHTAIAVILRSAQSLWTDIRTGYSAVIDFVMR